MAKNYPVQWAFDFMHIQQDECISLEQNRGADTWKQLLFKKDDPEFCKALSEISRKMPSDPQRQRVLICLADVARAWNTDELKAQRYTLTRVRELNTKISKASFSLAKKLALRDSLVNRYALGRNDGISFFECAERFSIIQGWGEYKRRTQSDPELFCSNVLPELDRLHERFDAKHWPDMHGLLSALAMLSIEASNGPGRYYDEVSLKAVNSRESSVRDLARALLRRLDNSTEKESGEGVRLSDHGRLPFESSLGHTTIASLVNAVIDADDEPITADNVRKLRGQNTKADN
jgi:hypothetical protein